MPLHVPQAVPEIPVSNVDNAAQHYANVLGFGIDWGKDDGGILGISRGDCRLFLEPVEDKPMHIREFTVADLDGNRLRVFYDFAWEARAGASP